MIRAVCFPDLEQLNEFVESHEPCKVISINAVYFDKKFDHYDLFYMLL